MIEERRPWISDASYISPWTYDTSKKLELPEDVIIYDVTLRDGEQYPGLVFRKEDKIRIAKALDRLGIKRIEAGMPAVYKDDFDAVKEIVKKVRAQVVVFCRGMKSDVDLAIETGAWGVIVELPSNERLIREGYLWSKEDVIIKAVKTCNYAKTKSLHTTFFLIDSSGADPDFLESLIKSVISQTDVDSIVAVDTFGRLNPEGTKLFVRKMKEWSKVPVEIHAHNDFGLATANSLAAIEAGAKTVHTNILGLGERSGGTATEEIAVALEFLYGIKTGLNLEKLFKSAKVIEEISGVLFPGHKPVVGKNSFSYEAGIAAMFSYRLFKKGFPLGVMPYKAEAVGNSFRIALGKKSGKYNILWHLEKEESRFQEEYLQKIVSKVKEKSLEKKSSLTTQEFISILEQV